jgi:uncharacterized membrane protein
MGPDLTSAAGPAPVERNVAAIAKLEQASLEQQTRAERISAAIARFCGSLSFVLVHVGLVVFWIAINQPSSSYRFDPYPYFLLVAIVAIEALLVSAFVLMNQNRMTVLAERRAHLGLQINLLAETEMTKVLNMLRALTEHLQVPGAEADEEALELARPTEVENVVRVIDEAMPAQKAVSGRGR